MFCDGLGSITSTFAPYFCAFYEQLFSQWIHATFFDVERKAKMFSAEK
jgi:hypothetical protein